MPTPAQVAFQVAYEANPIALVGGIAGAFPGGGMSVLNLMEAAGLDEVIDVGLPEVFANFWPQAGSTLIDYQVAQYPFANMTVAANAMIAQPTTISLLMRVPVRPSVTWTRKQAIMQSLQASLKQHCQSGGVFNVATPMFLWDNALLTGLRDASGGETQQTQYQLEWTFLKPLVTLDDAGEAQNAMMSALSGGGQTDAATSGVGNTVGAPETGAGPVVSPGSSGSQAVAPGVGPGPGGGAGFGGGSGGSPFSGARA